MSGSVSKPWSITERDISECTVTLSSTSSTFNGSLHGPSATVKYGSNTISTSNYSVSGGQMIAKGTYDITITGKANLMGSITKTYTIAAYTSVPTITLSGTSFTYTGSEHKPTISTVKIGSTTISSSYYSASYTYSSNKNAGTGYVKITFSGSISVTTSNISFTIASSCAIQPHIPAIISGLDSFKCLILPIYPNTLL